MSASWARISSRLDVLGLLDQEVLLVLEEHTLGQQNRTVVLEPVDQGHIGPVPGVAGLAPFHLLDDRQAEEDLPELGKLLLPPGLPGEELVDRTAHAPAPARKNPATADRRRTAAAAPWTIGRALGRVLAAIIITPVTSWATMAKPMRTMGAQRAGVPGWAAKAGAMKAYPMENHRKKKRWKPSRTLP
jgi:hypothetical protein